MNLGEIPRQIQAAGLYIGLPVLKRMGLNIEMRDVCRELQVDHTSILQQVRALFFAKNTENLSPSSSLALENKRLHQCLQEQSFLSAVYEYQAKHPGCWSCVERHQMSDDFKIFLIAKKEEFGLSWGEVSRLTQIPEDTLKKLKGQGGSDKDDDGSGISSLPSAVVDKIAEFFKGRSGKASVKEFCEKNPDILVELKMEYRAFSKLLLRLGFVSPKGIFLSNTGLDVIKRFAPNVVWGSDGKNINLLINGLHYRWVWQSLIDYKTTILVGGVIRDSETTENLLEAIKRSKEVTGVAPMAIVLDNRLSDNLPAIKAYLDELGIEIVKTFPGNSKSNGIIENNFKVFESWVHGKGGKIVINAKNEKELSLAISEMLVEVFTQLRNLAPRRSLGGKSASEVAKSIPPLTEHEQSLIRDEIKALANRLRNELATPVMTLAKEEALVAAIDLLKPPAPEVFRQRLTSSIYTAELILQALAIYKTQTTKYPEKTFDHTYFGGILRNLVDQEHLRLLTINLESTYESFWKNMNEKIQANIAKLTEPVELCTALIKEFLFAKIPAQGALVLLHLKNMLFLLAGQTPNALSSIRQNLVQKVLREKMMPIEKQELLVRKLFEIESQIRSFTKIPGEIIKNSTQVLAESIDKTLQLTEDQVPQGV